jgi:hypothetical protein
MIKANFIGFECNRFIARRNAEKFFVTQRKFTNIRRPSATAAAFYALKALRKLFQRPLNPSEQTRRVLFCKLVFPQTQHAPVR